LRPPYSSRVRTSAWTLASAPAVRPASRRTSAARSSVEDRVSFLVEVGDHD